MKKRKSGVRGKKYQHGNSVSIFAAQAKTILLTGGVCDVLAVSFILMPAAPWGLQNCPKTFPIRHMPLFRKCFSKVHFPAIACPSRFDEACVRFLSQLGAVGGPPGQLEVKSPRQMGPREGRKVKPLHSPENTLPCHVTPFPHLSLLWIKLQRHAFMFSKK